jgi:hypothetical protein
MAAPQRPCPDSEIRVKGLIWRFRPNLPGGSAPPVRRRGAVDTPPGGSSNAPVRLPVWAVAALTLVAECSVIRFATFRRDARGYSLGELALVTGLFLANPLVLVAGRLLGLAVIDAVQQRQHSLVKVAFNLAKTFLETCVAVVVFYALLQLGRPLGAAGWIAAIVTAVVADLLSKLLIDMAIRISGAPRPNQRWRQDLGIGVTVALGTTSIALIGVTLLWVHPQAAWLLLVPTTILSSHTGRTRENVRVRTIWRSCMKCPRRYRTPANSRTS